MMVTEVIFILVILLNKHIINIQPSLLYILLLKNNQNIYSDIQYRYTSTYCKNRLAFNEQTAENLNLHHLNGYSQQTSKSSTCTNKALYHSCQV